MYVACTRARQQLDLYAPSSLYSRAEQGMTHVNQSPFVRELPSGLAETWCEEYGGQLRRVRQSSPEDMPAARAAAPRSAFGGGRGLRRTVAMPETAVDDDSQLSPEEAAEVAGRRQAAPAATAAGAKGALPQGYCRHRIFGRGKVVRLMPPDKVQVNFPGFGLKVILAEYLLMEDD